ncbi:MAG: hypothetical protein IT377_26210 [Polyangiaceae bacterium]|nr:hypothetical protein [Polyangiaceae bacterium]
MKRLMAALIATLLLTAVPVGATEASVLRTAASAVAELVASATARQTAAPAPAPSAGSQIASPARIVRGRKIVNVPVRCRDAAGRYDLVVHFHGVPQVIEPVFQRAAIDAVFVVVNLGIGSGPYEDLFMQDGSLAALLGEIDQVVDKACPHPSGARGRVALSAWSAGYGAAYRVLANKKDRELVDAILLSDGLHAGFLDKFRQKMNDGQMAPFDAFAERAAKGDKLFAITHTAIVTPSYASTTETARYLIERRGLEARPTDEPGPRPTMKLTLKADAGGFHVRGYGGKDTDAHCDHLYAMGDTLYPMLRERWTR